MVHMSDYSRCIIMTIDVILGVCDLRSFEMGLGDSMSVLEG